MCSRGIFQLQRLSLFFCDFGGSSEGVRKLLMSQKLKQFMNLNKHINFEFICKRNYHPYISATYINGYIKDKPIRSYTDEQIHQAMIQLRNQLGRKSFKVSGTRVYSTVESVQGKWVPNMFNKYPIASYETVHPIPRPSYQFVEKPQQPWQKLKPKDKNNVMLKIRDSFQGGIKQYN